MIKVELIRGRNSKTKKVVVSLFADKREDLISGQEIHGMPDGYSIDFGSSCTTANGEMAYLKSDCATWVWVKVDPTTITLEELDVTENGEYTAESGKAYTPVIVQIPLGNKTVSANGTYTATDDNLQGYSEVTVEVPDPPVGNKSISTNGTYNASSDKLYGYDKVTVDVPQNTVGVKPDEITDNGIYQAHSDNLAGYSEVSVNVTPTLQDLTITVPDNKTYSSEYDGFAQVFVDLNPSTLEVDHNGEYTPEQSADVWTKVNVNVQPNLTTKSISINGTYKASGGGYDGFSQVTVEVPQKILTTKSIDTNGTYYASEDGYDGYSEVTVNVTDPNLGTLSVTENHRTYYASDTGHDGYSQVDVDTPVNVITLSADKNGEYDPGESSDIYYDGFSHVSVDVKHTIKFTTNEPPTNVSFENEEDTEHLIIMIPNGSEDAYRNAENFPDDAEYEEY